MTTKILKNSISLVIIMFLGISAFSQKHFCEDNQKDKIETRRATYYTKYLDLTKAEAEKFWPVYNEYTDKKTEIRKKNNETCKNVCDKNDSDISEKEADDMIKNHLATKQAMLDLEKEYIPKFKAVLPVNKVAKLMRAEHKFRGEVIKNVKHRNAKHRKNIKD